VVEVVGTELEPMAVEVVVELIGGTGAAWKLIERSLKAGKPVVTANKALLAAHGEEIFRLAAQKNTDIYFGASVGGCIPIVRALREGLIANHIESIHGILNGTSNYILTRMEAEGLSFDRVLADAQEMGYAEADPGLDIDGWDTAHKAVILASLAYGLPVPLDSVSVEGIRGLAEMDIRYAADLGYRIKLLAIIRQASRGGQGAEVEIRVHPALVPAKHVLASVSGVFNAVMVQADLAGRTLYYGRGAGQEPTASTVIGDIADVVRNLVEGSPCRVPAMSVSGHEVRLRNMGEVVTRHYLRLTVSDEPGVLAQIAAVLGERRISIASVIQKEAGAAPHTPVVLVTHAAPEKALQEAVAEIDGMAFVGAPTVRLRIEDLGDE